MKPRADNKSNPPRSRSFQLNRDLVIERFGKADLVFLADKGVFLEVNEALGSLLRGVRSMSRNRPFGTNEFGSFLHRRCNVPSRILQRFARRTLADWVRFGLIADLAPEKIGPKKG
jgi:hypothetical protein